MPMPMPTTPIVIPIRRDIGVSPKFTFAPPPVIPTAPVPAPLPAYYNAAPAPVPTKIPAFTPEPTLNPIPTTTSTPSSASTPTRAPSPIPKPAPPPATEPIPTPATVASEPTPTFTPVPEPSAVGHGVEVQVDSAATSTSSTPVVEHKRKIDKISQLPKPKNTLRKIISYVNPFKRAKGKEQQDVADNDKEGERYNNIGFAEEDAEEETTDKEEEEDIYEQMPMI